MFLFQSDKFSLSRLSDIGVKLNVPIPDGIVPTCEVGWIKVASFEL